MKVRHDVFIYKNAVRWHFSSVFGHITVNRQGPPLLRDAHQCVHTQPMCYRNHTSRCHELGSAGRRRGSKVCGAPSGVPLLWSSSLWCSLCSSSSSLLCLDTFRSLDPCYCANVKRGFKLPITPRSTTHLCTIMRTSRSNTPKHAHPPTTPHLGILVECSPTLTQSQPRGYTKAITVSKTIQPNEVICVNPEACLLLHEQTLIHKKITLPGFLCLS